MSIFNRKTVIFTAILALGLICGLLYSMPANAASCTVKIVSPADGATVSTSSSLPVRVFVDCSSPYKVSKFTYNINSTVTGSTKTFVLGTPTAYGYIDLPAFSASTMSALGDKLPGQYASLTVTFTVCTSATESCANKFIAYDRTVAIKFPSKTSPTNPRPTDPPPTIPSNLNVSCYASPVNIQEESYTTFIAQVSGGTPNYNYSWSGTVNGNRSSVSKYCNVAGTYKATVTVTDSKGQYKSATCYAYASSKPTQPTYPPVTYPPVTYPPVTYPPVTYPPVTYPPVTYPPVTYPPVTYPPVTYPPITTQRFSCNNTVGQCSTDANGPYTSYSTCSVNCQVPTKYSCNQLTWQCVIDSNGSYTDPGTCQTFCKQPVSNPTVTINANPSVINRGQTSILTWNSQNATYCTASGAWSGSKAISGQETVSPYTTSTYVITCYNSQGASASASTIVTVNDINPTVDINVYPSTIYKGQAAMLSWTSQNAYNCTGSSTNNVWTGSKSTSGSEQTSPSQTTTYTITCTGQNGNSVSDWTTLNVTESTGQYLTLNKLGRNLSNGENAYGNVIRVKAGDVIEFYLQVDNLSGNQLYNVTVSDNLPIELKYYAGTTKIDNIAQADGIASGGINLGTLNSGSRKTITFQAIAQPSTSLFAVTNIASVRADNNTTISDSATVTYSSVAGASTVITGPAETMLMILGGTSSITAGAWYFLKKTKKGKTLLEKIQEDSIKKQISRFRVK